MRNLAKMLRLVALAALSVQVLSGPVAVDAREAAPQRIYVPGAPAIGPVGQGLVVPGVAVDPASQFFARLSTQPTTARKALYTTLINSLVASGVWAKLDALYIFAAADQATALTNLVQASYGATVVTGPTFAADIGFTGGAGYINSNFTPSTATAPNYVQDGAFLAARTTTDNATAGGLVGQVAAVTARSLLYPSSGGNAVAWVNSSGGVSTANAATAALWALTRTAANLTTLYKDTTAFGTSAAASTALPPSAITFLSDASTQSFAGTCLSGAIGGGLTSTDVANFYAAEHAYMQAVAAVP